MLVDEALLERQVAMELRSKERGVEAFNAAFSKAQADLRGENTEAGIFLVKQAVQPVAEAIKAFIDKAMGGGAGRRAMAAVFLKDIDPYLLAYLTMTTLVSSVAVFRTRTVTAAATALVRGLEMELKMAAFDAQKPGLYATVMGHMTERGATAPHIARVVTYAANKYGVEWEGWATSERIQIGAALIDIALQTTGIAEMTLIPTGRNKTSYVLTPTPAIVEWVRDRSDKLSTIRPVTQPMIVPPRPWKGLRGGGFRSDHILKSPVVKRMPKAHAELLKGAYLDTTMTGLNAIQDTPWAINRPVYDVAAAMWEAGRELPGAVSREDVELPVKPGDIETNEEARRAWKEAAKGVYELQHKSRSKRLLAAQTIKMAGELVDEAAIYFPHNLDFRGRCYARPSALHPQGADLAKALLTFAHGKPIGERGAGWLAIHGANSFGVDKVSHADRIDWVTAHREDIAAVAADPLGNSWWHEADSPWAFLAFCFDWAGVLRDDVYYVSALPIPMDGSCNGIQHYSAMLRDPVGGAAVNLTVSGDKPQDIYGTVAGVVLQKLQAIADDPNDEKAWIAQSWITFGIDRKMTKRQVMVLPYGGTRNSCVKYTQKAVRESIDGGKEDPFGAAELPKHSMWLGGVIWDAIGETVVAARDAMGWLQKVARIATKANVPLSWTTPSGFVAFQAYKETRERRVKTRINGSLVYFSHHEDTDKLDKYKQPSGVAPNFVHSLDASAMMLTIELAKNNGVGQFAMIHDSYGTLAADTDMLAYCIRHAFHDMYTENDVLARFRDDVAARLDPEDAAKLPPLPAKGTLDLSGVFESPFFFS